MLNDGLQADGSRSPMRVLSVVAVLLAVAISTSSFGQVQPAPSETNTPAIRVGTLADTVLKVRGKSVSIRQVGRDGNGLLVEWEYPDVTYLMGRRLQDGIEAYRVIKITPSRR